LNFTRDYTKRYALQTLMAELMTPKEISRWIAVNVVNQCYKAQIYEEH